MGFSQKKALDTLYIKTSALCQDCKQRIESTLNYQKGVKYAVLDLDTKVATVIHKINKISPLALRQAISKSGYDADEIKADPNAVVLLPKCCQPGGH
jgi:copper chaperone CopZ